MRSNRIVAFACLFVAVGIAGCGTLGTQVLVFGTDTKVALDASSDPTGQPSFTLGYKRREAVWLPLLSRGKLYPPTHQCKVESKKLVCKASDKITLSTHVCVVPPNNEPGNATVGGKSMLCLPDQMLTAKFIGKKGEDAYSVMASFGLDSSGSNAKIAQYFATGLAARALAKSGGAALVSPEAMSPSAVMIIQNEKADIDLIVTHVTKSSQSLIDTTKFENLVDQTKMEDPRKKSLKQEAKTKTPAQLRSILGEPRYKSCLGQLIGGIK